MASPGSAIQSSIADLPPGCALRLRRVEQWIERDDLAAAERALIEVQQMAPGHPAVDFAHATLVEAQGNPAEALPILRRVWAGSPADSALLIRLGVMLRRCGDAQTAYAALTRASERAPDSAQAWWRLGELLRDGAYPERARAALMRARALAPLHVPIRLAHADTLTILGLIDQAADELRHAIRLDPRRAQAWQGLADLKTVGLTRAEVAELERLYRQPNLSVDDRATFGFALAAGFEGEQRYAEAFDVLAEANAAKRTQVEWNREAFSEKVDACIAHYVGVSARAADSTLGENTIFIVSMPRSGSTLTEQILASHSHIEGGGELPDLSDVIMQECARRGSEIQVWAGQATAADWERMGRDYLRRTERWRKERPILVDKGLSNFMLVGAISSMLPGARIIECRRDALETCWACFRQLFKRGTYFSYDLDDIVAFWHDYQRLMAFWKTSYPQRIHEQVYEQLIENPQAQIRRLLAECGLEFEPACLNFHETRRRVGTASAAQVRTPLRRDTARATLYGALLDPLRRKLERAT